MSIAEVERFSNALAKDPKLRDSVRPQVSGLVSVVALGNKLGYSFTLEEAKSYILSKTGRALTERQLAAISGGAPVNNNTSSSGSSTVEITQTATTVHSVTQAVDVVNAAAVTEVAAVIAAVLI